MYFKMLSEIEKEGVLPKSFLEVISTSISKPDKDPVGKKKELCINYFNVDRWKIPQEDTGN